MDIPTEVDEMLWRVVVYARMGWVAANNGNPEEATGLAWYAAQLREQAERLVPPDVVAKILDARFTSTYRRGFLEHCR